MGLVQSITEGAASAVKPIASAAKPIKTAFANPSKTVGNTFRDPSLKDPASALSSWSATTNRGSRGFHGGWREGLQGAAVGSAEGSGTGAGIGALVGLPFGMAGPGAIAGAVIGGGIGGVTGGYRAAKGGRESDWTVGGGADPVLGGQAARHEKESQKADEQSIQRTAAAQNALIQQNREAYASPQLAAMRQQYVDQARLAAQQQAGTAFGGQLTQNRIRAAQSGNIGGSMELGGQNEALGNYYAQMGQAAANAANLGQTFDQQMQQQRLAQEAQIRGSQIADLSGQRVDLAGLLNQANMGTMTANALGSALPQLASGAANYTIAKQYGG